MTTDIDTVDIRSPETRFHTDIGWLDSWHCFSFGHHVDLTNTGHGLLIVSNDDRVAPGGGFGTHPHRDMEIVTWVLEGSLEHQDSAGHRGVLYPGLAQRMSAGTGITHSERNHSSSDPVHFVQMWVPPDTSSQQPSYEQRDLNDALDAGGLVAVASGQGHEGAITIQQRHAVMWVARLADAEAVAVPAAPFVHLFVARGSVELDGRSLPAGAAARLTDAGAMQVTASGSAEIIVWESSQEATR